MAYAGIGIAFVCYSIYVHSMYTYIVINYRVWGSDIRPRLQGFLRQMCCQGAMSSRQWELSHRLWPGISRNQVHRRLYIYKLNQMHRELYISTYTFYPFAECDWGYHGYNCNETCQSCSSTGNGSCNAVTGLCPLVQQVYLSFYRWICFVISDFQNMRHIH